LDDPPRFELESCWLCCLLLSRPLWDPLPCWPDFDPCWVCWRLLPELLPDEREERDDDEFDELRLVMFGSVCGR
jgi:hypothetical protein